jgi:MFS transporter, CP family, cyanate transporter
VSTRTAPPPGLSRWAVGAIAGAIVLVALNLRPAVVGVGPLLAEIRADQALSGTAAGILTALPVLCFGLLAPVAPRLARRVGIERTILCALATLVVGCVVRTVPAVWALYAGTVLIGAAIASGNVMLPALIKRDFAHRTGTMTAVYSTAISLGGALGAAVTVPLADAAGLGWRWALGAWGLFGALALLAWLPQVRRVQRPSEPGAVVGSLARQPLAWQVTVYMGLQSLGFYASAAWLPTVFVERGYTAAEAGVLAATMSLTGILGGMSAPVLAARARDQRLLGVVVTVVCGLGYGAVLVPGLEWPAVAALGIAQGGALGLALTLMALRSPDAPHAAQLSGMAQCLGYTMAAAGPLAVGALHDLTDGWTVPLVVLLVLLVPQVTAAVLAGRARQLRS